MAPSFPGGTGKPVAARISTSADETSAIDAWSRSSTQARSVGRIGAFRTTTAPTDSLRAAVARSRPAMSSVVLLILTSIRSAGHEPVNYTGQDSILNAASQNLHSYRLAVRKWRRISASLLSGRSAVERLAASSTRWTALANCSEA